MFINSDHKILAQEEIIEKLRLEIVGLTQERDNLISGNRELMRGKSEIVNIASSKEKELYTIESILQETNRALSKESNNFNKLTEKQREELQKINTLIQERLDELSIQEGKELIDIDSENRKIKKQLTESRKQLQAMKDDAESLKDERIAFEKEKKETRKTLDEEHERYINYMNSLEKRENTLKWQEELHEKTVQKFIQKRDKIK